MKSLFRCIATAAVLAISSLCCAQIKWIDPIGAGAQVHGQGWSELQGTYVRLPDSARPKVNDGLWGLSRHCAGLSLVFISDASNIAVRYQTTDSNYSSLNLTGTGKSGVDLFCIDAAGKERWLAPDFPPKFADTITYTYSSITHHPSGAKEYEYHLYLPLYNGLKWLNIGVPSDAKVEFLPCGEGRPVVCYGTSILQGASATRPGQAWTTIIERRMRIPFVNLGFSGSARLEPEMFDILNEIDARMYVIDAMPNNSPGMPIYERVVSGVKKLRKSHSCPILLVEHSGYPNVETRDESSSFVQVNAELERAYRSLKAEGVKDLYYLPFKKVGYSTEETVEGIHPNDIGMNHTADVCEKAIRKILRKSR